MGGRREAAAPSTAAVSIHKWQCSDGGVVHRGVGAVVMSESEAAVHQWGEVIFCVKAFFKNFCYFGLIFMPALRYWRVAVACVASQTGTAKATTNNSDPQLFEQHQA